MLPHHDTSEYSYADILDWLDTVAPTPPSPSKSKRGQPLMPSPETSSGPRSASPSKRRRVDDGADQEDRGGGENRVGQDGDQNDGEEALGGTPRSSDPGGQAQRGRGRGRGKGQSFPLLQRPPPSSTSSRRRGTSPVKDIVSLQALEKPVVFTTPPKQGNAAESLLPAEVRGLYKHLKETTITGRRFVPRAVQEKVRAENDDWVDVWVMTPEDEDWAPTDKEDGGDLEASQKQAGQQSDNMKITEEMERRAARELEALLEIATKAEESLSLRRHELSWNGHVHAPLLELAIDRGPNGGAVKAEYIPSARISSPFMPTMQESLRTPHYHYPQSDIGSTTSTDKSSVTNSKMIDFAILLDTKRDEDPTLCKALTQFVVFQWDSPSEQTVNQSTYRPLQSRPIGVSIETKAGNVSTEKGCMQLAIWVAAWHRRMEELLRTQDKRVIALPLILVETHAWSLYFACDRGDRIEIVGSWPIGGTGSLTDLYRLVASLRALAAWVNGPFRKWISDVFGVTSGSE